MKTGQVVYGWFDRQATFAAFGESTRNEIASLPYAHDATNALEQKWIAQGFEADIKRDRFVAPPGPRPCEAIVNRLAPSQRGRATLAFAALGEADPDTRLQALATIADHDPSNHLVGLLLARELAVLRSYKRAEAAARSTLESTPAAARILESARNPSTTLSLDDQSLATVIHLYHVLGIAQLSPAGSQPPWVALKEVIASVLPLSRRTALGPGGRGVTAEAKLGIPTPGCDRMPSDLSSYDLFNNLIVAYWDGGYRNPEKAEEEFRRGPKVYPSAVRELFIGQRDRERSNHWPDESQLWALSNVDRVLDFGTPDDGRISLNAIQVVDWWSDPARCPGDLCTGELKAKLSQQRLDLLKAALSGQRVAVDQRERFAATVIGMLVRTRVDREPLRPQMQTLTAWLKEPERGVAADLIASERARHTLAQWIVEGAPARPPWATMGRNAEAWRASALADFANAAVSWARDRSAADRDQTMIALRHVFGEEALPPSAQELMPPTHLGRILIAIRSSRVAWLGAAILFGLFAWLFLVWVILQIREYLLLHTSFYEVEREYIDYLLASREDSDRSRH